MKEPEKESIDPEIVAVIAAAIAAVIDQPIRLVSVKRVALPPPHPSVWAFEGRVELSTSHRMR